MNIDIIKDLSDTCGMDNPYATKSGWYIVEDYHDGRVKVSEYDAETNKWSEDKTVWRDSIVQNGEVANVLEWAWEVNPVLAKQRTNQITERAMKIAGEEYNRYVSEAVDFYMQNFAFEIFGDLLKEHGVAYKDDESLDEDPQDCLSRGASYIYIELEK